jgi:hypothetical protein
MAKKLIPAAAAVTLVVAVALAGGTASGPASASELPEHGHVMLLGAIWTGSGPGTDLESYERCVDLANGRALKNHAHHANIHTGSASEAVKKSGHLVIPTAPLAPPWLTGCAAINEMFGT